MKVLQVLGEQVWSEVVDFLKVYLRKRHRYQSTFAEAITKEHGLKRVSEC